MEYRFEELGDKHLEAVAELLNYYVENSTAAYRRDRVTGDQLTHFLNDSPAVHCSYAVVDREGRCVGFFLLEPHSSLSTFERMADVMYFIHPGSTGKGLGVQILHKLEEEARKRGIGRLLADISSENEGSIRFHKRHGFVEYGHLERAGNKFGRDFGIVYLYKELEA